MMLFWHKQKKRLSLTCAGFRNLESLLAQVLPVSRSLLTVFSELVINELLTSNDTRSSPKHFSRNDNTLSGRWKIPNEVLRGTLGDTWSVLDYAMLSACCFSICSVMDISHTIYRSCSMQQLAKNRVNLDATVG
jgi:hypothetical protein